MRTAQPLVGGVLATRGNLLFVGEGNGSFNAFDSRSGDRLWQFHCEAGVYAPPVTYRIDGKQYVAVAVGGSQILCYKQGDLVYAFALDD
jgi:alcohol dehydrogenase (cytochrome c)